MSSADIGGTGLRMVYGCCSAKEHLPKENTYFECTQPAKFDVLQQLLRPFIQGITLRPPSSSCLRVISSYVDCVASPLVA
jgi:hypothetical protein